MEACKQLLEKSKKASESAESETVRENVTENAKNIAQSVHQLLEAVKDITITGNTLLVNTH